MLNKDCYMLIEKNDGDHICRALETLRGCGTTCPFAKTLEQQREIEKNCAKRLLELYGRAVEYKSCIDGSTILKKRRTKNGSSGL